MSSAVKLGRGFAAGGILGLGLCLCLAGDARASVPDHYGLGSRSTAMAGAVGADAVDFSAAYYNAAGLVGAPGIEVSVGYLYNQQSLAINGADTEVAPVHGLVGGVVAPGRLFGIPFAFGIATHLPDNGISFIYARRQGIPRWELYDTRSQLLYLSANLAIQPFEWLQLGGGIAYLSATRGRFGIRGRADILDPYVSKLQHEVDADLTSVRFPQLGLRVLLGKWGAVGATYRGQSKLDLRLGAHLEGVVDFAGIDVPLLYDLETHTIASFTPQQVVLALSFQRVERLHVNVDLTWVNWAAYESPTADVWARLEVEPPPGTPLELPDEPLPTKIVAPDFDNRLVPRFGVEYRVPLYGEPRAVHGQDEPRPLIELPVRVGYVYEKTPVPDQTGVSNLVDTDRHSVTAGLGVTVNAPGEVFEGSLHFDAHGSVSVLPERETLKDNPADFIGDYRASGSMWALGWTLGAVF